MSWLTRSQLDDLGVVAGADALVSSDARIFGGERLRIGDNVRIDAFSLISTGAEGFVTIGSHVHIATGVRLFGGGGISIGDFGFAAAACTVLSVSDDFSGRHLMGPGIDHDFLEVRSSHIEFGDYAGMGAHGLMLPGGQLGEGAVLGAMSMTASPIPEWTIAAGIPARPIKSRDRTAQRLGVEFRARYARRSAPPATG